MPTTAVFGLWPRSDEVPRRLAGPLSSESLFRGSVGWGIYATQLGRVAGGVSILMWSAMQDGSCLPHWRRGRGSRRLSG